MWRWGGVESQPAVPHPWVLSPYSPSSLLPLDWVAGAEAPSPAPGVFPGLGSGSPSGAGVGGESSTEQRLGGEAGSREKEGEGAEYTLRPPLQELPPPSLSRVSCPERVWARM